MKLQHKHRYMRQAGAHITTPAITAVNDEKFKTCLPQA